MILIIMILIIMILIIMILIIILILLISLMLVLIYRSKERFESKKKTNIMLLTQFIYQRIRRE